MTTDELAAHKHNSILDDTLATEDSTRPYADAFTNAAHWSNHYRFIDNNIKISGGNKPHNNVQPSIAAYCWKRTA